MVRTCFMLVPFLLAMAGCGMGATKTPATHNAETAPASPAGEGTLVVVNGDGELGSADYGQRKTTTFTVKNETARPLNLFVADKNCQCAGVAIEPTRVPPGQTTKVTIAWAPNLDQPTTEVVRVRSIIQAQEDPTVRLQLEADGRIQPTLQISLPRGRLDFGKMLVADVKSGKKELGLEIYTQEASRKRFTVQAKSLSPGLEVSAPQPLSADRLAALQAVAGYRINIRAVDGLPIGIFRETVRLSSDVYPDRGLDVTVGGMIESGAVSLSREWIELPARIPLERGYNCPPLEIELRGEPGRTVAIDRVEPKFLKVRLEPVGGKENTWRVRVRVPAGELELLKDLAAEQLSDYTSYGFEGGAVLLRTDHPRLPVLRIPVSASRFQR